MAPFTDEILAMNDTINALFPPVATNPVDGSFLDVTTKCGFTESRPLARGAGTLDACIARTVPDVAGSVSFYDAATLTDALSLAAADAAPLATVTPTPGVIPATAAATPQAAFTKGLTALVTGTAAYSLSAQLAGSPARRPGFEGTTMTDKALLAQYGFSTGTPVPKRPQTSYFELDTSLPRKVREARVRQAQRFSPASRGIDLARLDSYSFDVVESTALREAEQAARARASCSRSRRRTRVAAR